MILELQKEVYETIQDGYGQTSFMESIISRWYSQLECINCIHFTSHDRYQLLGFCKEGIFSDKLLFTVNEDFFCKKFIKASK